MCGFICIQSLNDAHSLITSSCSKRKKISIGTYQITITYHCVDEGGCKKKKRKKKHPADNYSCLQANCAGGILK